MGLYQTKSNEKTDEEIKNDMKRKWDNFGKTQATKVEEQESAEIDDKNNNTPKEAITKDDNNTNNQNIQNTGLSELNLKIKEE